MTIDVTVVSAFYNREDGVDLSLQSLRDQQDDGFRALVVDDGSTDGTLQRLKAYESPRISIVSQVNAGLTRTLATICAGIDTEFIAIHGAGDESLPNRIATQRAFLRANPHVVAVGCGIENVDEISGDRWDVMPPAAIKPGPIKGSFGISHGEVMFRRDAYQRVGGYRALFPVGQGTDLFRRLSRLGDFGYVQEVLYRRYLRLDGVSARADKVAQRDILAALSTAVHASEVARGVPAPAKFTDDLDRFGILLPYFAAPDRDMAVALARAAVKMWSAGDRPVALRLARRSLGEKWTRQGLLAWAAVHFGHGPLADPMARMVERGSGGKGEVALSRLRNAVPKTAVPYRPQPEAGE